MTRVAAVVPGYSSVAHAAEVLHLAARSVRDLIYTGRLPSVRIGRLHFIRGTDLEREHRRRLGLPLPSPRRSARGRPPGGHKPADPALRAQRAAERTAVRLAWAQQHHTTPSIPFHAATSRQATACAVCHRPLPAGAALVEERGTEQQAAARQLCPRCGRRALLGWADQRRAEAAAARALAEELPSPRRPEGGDVSDRAAA